LVKLRKEDFGEAKADASGNQVPTDASGDQISASRKADPPTKPAELMPSSKGFAAIISEGSYTQRPSDKDSDLDSVMSEADWETFESFYNLHEFQYEQWTQELHQGRLNNGPPLALVVAKTHIDMTTGEIFVIDGVEQYRVPHTFSVDEKTKGLLYSPIKWEAKTQLRAIHYYDALSWKPRGNWANDHWAKRTKKTIRTLEMRPELRRALTPKQKQTAIKAWQDKLKRRKDEDAIASKRQIIRDRTNESQAPTTPVIAAVAFDFAAWKPYLHRVYELAEISEFPECSVPAMPVFDKDFAKNFNNIP
jgi:hypothetical protein